MSNNIGGDDLVSRIHKYAESCPPEDTIIVPPGEIGWLEASMLENYKPREQQKGQQIIIDDEFIFIQPGAPCNLFFITPFHL